VAVGAVDESCCSDMTTFFFVWVVL
jgi:hypothetical protein